MIAGIGIDLARIARFETLLEKYPQRAAEKILAPVEHSRFAQAAKPAAWLAKRWAVKEAFGKALGTGIAQGITLPEIAVVNSDIGEPRLELSGIAASVVAARGIDQIHLSISDEAEFAVALVVLEKTSAS